MIEVRIDQLVLDDALHLDPEEIRAATVDALTEPSLDPTETTGFLDAARVGRELAARVKREVASRW